MHDRDAEPGAAGVRGTDSLIERARGGDRDALGELWSIHQHLLLRFLRGVGCPSPDDIASIVWLEVAQGLDGFDGDLDRFRGWLFTIARRRSIDDLRRRTRRGEASFDSVPQPAAADDVAETVERATALERAIALVRTLPSDQAEIVLLRVVADLDVADVARIVGKSEGNVRVIVHRALKKLAEGLRVTETDTPTMDRVP
ncbi:MAG: RNA polymerase sigma factor [Ilumatobacteraceae bacterium]